VKKQVFIFDVFVHDELRCEEKQASGTPLRGKKNVDCARF